MIIVDASVVNKLFLPLEEDYDKANKLFEDHIFGLNEILVPDLVLYEVVNTLVTKSSITQHKTTRSISKLYRLKLTIISTSEKRLKTASKFARKYKVSIYDAIYAVLAKEKKCNLITADEKFADKVNLEFVKKLSRIKNFINYVPK